mmetsp:Transcript_41612/g.110135  ORF Transcript_41612/g.110135 Transcript_41612/m.110135 type:complete len:277 (+) Transcript_41612:750-1580(+)
MPSCSGRRSPRISEAAVRYHRHRRKNRCRCPPPSRSGEPAASSALCSTPSSENRNARRTAMIVCHRYHRRRRCATSPQRWQHLGVLAPWAARVPTHTGTGQNALPCSSKLARPNHQRHRSCRKFSSTELRREPCIGRTDNRQEAQNKRNQVLHRGPRFRRPCCSRARRATICPKHPDVLAAQPQSAACVAWQTTFQPAQRLRRSNTPEAPCPLRASHRPTISARRPLLAHQRLPDAERCPRVSTRSLWQSCHHCQLASQSCVGPGRPSSLLLPCCS